MIKPILHRLISVIVTLFLSTILIFVLIRMAPGDPVRMFLGSPSDMPLLNTSAYEERVEELRDELGLDQSMPIQYINWLKRLVHFDMGTSIYTKQPVGQEILQRIPATLLLSSCAMLIQLLIGVVFGILSAVKAGKATDGIIRFICVFFASLPGFVLGLSLLSFFAVTLQVYEISNSAEISRLWLPAITLGLIGAPQLTRMIRANMLSELGQLYVTSALARGLRRREVLMGTFRNALIPIATMITHTFATLMGGSVIIESVFTWPGIGEYALTSVLRHDYPVIQAYAVVTVSIVIIINLLAELLYALLDPQIYRKGAAIHEKN
jgi:peptide/nickel transport system permease protein